MQPVHTHEAQWLEAMRQAWGHVYVGLDHHSRQITVAAASGVAFQQHQSLPNASWMPTATFAQDGIGYVELLDWLSSQFPDTPQDRFVFVSEPTFAKPLGSFLVAAGYVPAQVLWIKTTEVGPYRKAKAIGKSGKNDEDDARTLATMAFETQAMPHERRGLFQAAPWTPISEGLKHLAADHRRLTRQSVVLQNQITDLVLRVFPECRRVWSRKEKVRKPDGTTCEQQLLNLFGSALPSRILAEYPGARAIAEAGYDRLWQQFGGPGIPKRTIRKLVDLAERSGGLSNPLDAKRLQLLLKEYQQVQERLQAYREAINEVFAADPVLESLQQIAFLGPQVLATIIGAMGDVSRFASADAVKRYLNVAPVPMPQSGRVDEQGRPIQAWRMPANTYRRENGKKQLLFASPGLKTVRVVAYQWFEVVMRCARAAPDDPFVQLYQRLKKKHQGTPGWLGRVRWKVVAKMISVIFHCLKQGRRYDPARIIPPPLELMSA